MICFKHQFCFLPDFLPHELMKDPVDPVVFLKQNLFLVAQGKGFQGEEAGSTCEL